MSLVSFGLKQRDSFVDTCLSIYIEKVWVRHNLVVHAEENYEHVLALFGNAVHDESVMQSEQPL